jgi:hypothetical protein
MSEQGMEPGPGAQPQDLYRLLDNGVLALRADSVQIGGGGGGGGPEGSSDTIFVGLVGTLQQCGSPGPM